MQRLLITFALLAALPLGAAARDHKFGETSTSTFFGRSQHVLARDEWVPAAHSDVLLKIPALHSILERFEEKPGFGLIIRHPGEAGGKAWAEEVRRWLVANGIPADRIHLHIGARRADQLELRIARL